VLQLQSIILCVAAACVMYGRLDVSRPRVGIYMATGQISPTQSYSIYYFISFNRSMNWDGSGLQIGGSAAPQSWTITTQTPTSANVTVTGMVHL
jgi:hypothetical protein